MILYTRPVKKAQKGEKTDGEMYYDYFPRLKNTKMQVIPDTTYTREKTGMGSLEFMPSEEDTVRYPNGYKYANPNYRKGINTVVYNPKEADQLDVALDMVSHGLSDEDKDFAKLKDRYDSLVYNAYKEKQNDFYNKAVEEGNWNGTKEQFIQNDLDGRLRNMIFYGNPEDYRKHRYWEYERTMEDRIPGVTQTIRDIRNHLGVPYYY